eukprot:Skav221151  [mRNA]  locus=scaffold2925:171012:174989:+ [translate_table: standard]
MEGWQDLDLFRGDVFQADLNGPEEDGRTVEGTFVIAAVVPLPDGSRKVEVRSMGTSDPEWTYNMSKQFNRKTAHIHVCPEGAPCSYEGEVALHMDALELLDPDDLNVAYVGNNGRRLMKQIRDTLRTEARGREKAPDIGGVKVPGVEEPPRSKRKDSKTVEKERRGKGDGSSSKKAGGDEEEKHAALRRRLASVREARKASSGAIPVDEDDSGWELAGTLDLNSGRAVEKRKSALKTGSRLPEVGAELRSLVATPKRSTGRAITNQQEQSESTMKSSTSATGKSVEEQLIARAVTAQGQKDERKRRRRSEVQVQRRQGPRGRRVRRSGLFVLIRKRQRRTIWQLWKRERQRLSPDARNICRWVAEDEVMTYRNEKVLNGTFGVRKNSTLPNGQPILRLIMNLIPSNAIHTVLEGRVNRLPSICSWLNIYIAEDELVTVCQSDMSAAFYLFSLPKSWSSHLCFNLSFTAAELGLSEFPGQQRVYLGCTVLPMGWSSAVGIMQYIAEEVLLSRGFPSEGQVRGGKPLPPWMVRTCKEAAENDQMWWHVYLDNYASGERVKTTDEPTGGRWQSTVETWWEEAGIVCSSQKSKVDEVKATELGAYISGTRRWIGASPERLIKLIKTTFWLLHQKRAPKKLLQVIMGRWVFVLQFRRPAMCHFQRVWECISSEKAFTVSPEAKTELFTIVWGTCLLHCFLGAQLENGITCSDASMSGGAVAYSEDVSEAGQDLLLSQEKGCQGTKVPIVIVSLFNGVGGSFRCYDLAGAQILGGLAVEIHKPAQRIMARRWPNVVQWGDIKTLTEKDIEQSLSRFEPFSEIHVWAGFPCIDLSKVKANRLNLDGPGSSLIHEAVRVIKPLRRLYPRCILKRVIENVASMDVSARQEISELLNMEPLKLDPRNQVPMGRPRFAWTDAAVEEVEGIRLVPREGYTDMEISGTWPPASSWLEDGCEQVDSSVVYPTCMKSIKRSRPPIQPAGISRCDSSTLERWESDSFRFPPYQYKWPYLIWDPQLDSLRLLSPLERERLMGLGDDITLHCWSASEAKQDKSGYRDERLSLIGDSFACSSFMVIAAFLVAPWLGKPQVHRLNNRLGIPVGVCLGIELEWPLGKRLVTPWLKPATIPSDLNAFLACRTKHTGSDVRITTGQLLNPKLAIRQSVLSSWWIWKKAFRVRWDYQEHINPLELRAILLGLLWKGRQGILYNARIFHLTDSYVRQAILAKGRTSSLLMRPLVRRVNAVLLVSGCQLYIAHVDSMDNPTDGDSRR